MGRCFGKAWWTRCRVEVGGVGGQLVRSLTVRVQSVAFVFGHVKVATVGQRAKRGWRLMPFLLVCSAAWKEVQVHGNANIGVQGGSIVSRR
jgi:hypothetical protein